MSTKASSLKLTFQGILEKKSKEEDVCLQIMNVFFLYVQWEERYCIIKSGVFCYFRTQEKLNIFLEMTCKQKHLNELREQLKEALKTHQPRGFIKLLNGKGDVVSYVQTQNELLVFHITHVKSQRTFMLRCHNLEAFDQWIDIFKQMNIPISTYPSNNVLEPQCKVSTTPTIESNNNDNVDASHINVKIINETRLETLTKKIEEIRKEDDEWLKNSSKLFTLEE
ncbi:hypothetical protein RFI_30967 [Reticulomyxa filosa]|uniref:PH domain-containing protein n=1 Tax=Reticulomyxa filosa TaxID=46433 RepID=X6LWY8_RETFI|nr:hypothetical protein RFI_30967 [Reticulomyxa filosa]|eukprot:ETO06428.1 hypothetical protein RFI_30967 [Reticulomyxa filosa]